MRYAKKQLLHKLFQDPTQPLGKLIERSQALGLLNERVQQLLPATIAKGCTVVHYEAGILSLSTSSAAILTQLRYSQAAILEQLRKDPAWCQLRALKMKVGSPLLQEVQPKLEKFVAPAPSLQKEQWQELKEWIKRLSST